MWLFWEGEGNCAAGGRPGHGWAMVATTARRTAARAWRVNRCGWPGMRAGCGQTQLAAGTTSRVRARQVTAQPGHACALERERGMWGPTPSAHVRVAKGVVKQARWSCWPSRVTVGHVILARDPSDRWSNMRSHMCRSRPPTTASRASETARGPPRPSPKPSAPRAAGVESHGWSTTIAGQT